MLQFFFAVRSSFFVHSSRFAGPVGRTSRCRAPRDTCNMSTANAEPATWPLRVRSANALNAYLQRSRELALSAPGSAKLHVLLGNQSADLDSIVSAVVLAFFKDSVGEKSVIPVLNCPRTDIHLRGDAMAVFRGVGVDVASMTTIDEVNIASGSHRVTLVDHNEPAPHQGFLDSLVCGVVDHHEDTGRYLNAVPRIVERVASCSTLISEICEDILQGDKYDAAVAALLLCTVVVDSGNYSRATERDLKVAHALCESLDVSDSLRKTLNSYLSQSKKSLLQSLPTADLLRYDYKGFEAGGVRLGIASVGMSLEKWISRSADESFGLSDGLLQDWGHGRGVDVVILMTTDHSSGTLSRELLLKDIGSRKLARGIADAVASDCSELDPLSVAGLDAPSCLVFAQSDNTKSRKKVSPVVLKFLASQSPC